MGWLESFKKDSQDKNSQIGQKFLKIMCLKMMVGQQISTITSISLMTSIFMVYVLEPEKNKVLLLSAQKQTQKAAYVLTLDLFMKPLLAIQT